jgi:hypothetical protein
MRDRMRRIVDYLWVAEHRDYEECAKNGNSQENHIWHDLVALAKDLDRDPDETQEGLTILDLRDALERIAYPKNWPDEYKFGIRADTGQWMQSVAADALTNAGTYNFERKANH